MEEKMEENNQALVEILKGLTEAVNKQSLDTAKAVSTALTEAFTQQNAVISDGLKTIISDKEQALAAKEADIALTKQNLSSKDKELLAVREELDAKLSTVKKEYVALLAEQKKQSDEISAKYAQMHEAFIQEKSQAEKAIQSESLSTLLSTHKIIPELRGAVNNLLQGKLSIQSTDAGKVVLFDGKPLKEGFSGWLATSEGKAFQLPEVSTGAVNTNTPTPVSDVDMKPYLLPSGEPNLTLIGKNWDVPEVRSIYGQSINGSRN